MVDNHWFDPVTKIHIKTGETENEKGFRIDWINVHTWTIYDENWYDIDWNPEPQPITPKSWLKYVNTKTKWTIKSKRLNGSIKKTTKHISHEIKNHSENKLVYTNINVELYEYLDENTAKKIVENHRWWQLKFTKVTNISNNAGKILSEKNYSLNFPNLRKISNELSMYFWKFKWESLILPGLYIDQNYQLKELSKFWGNVLDLSWIEKLDSEQCRILSNCKCKKLILKWLNYLSSSDKTILESNWLDITYNPILWKTINSNFFKNAIRVANN